MTDCCERVIVVEQAPADALVIGVPGPQGPAGPPGSSGAAPVAAFTAGTALSSQRLVVLDAQGRAVYAEAGAISHAGRLVGATVGSAAALAQVPVQAAGEIQDSAWSWTPSQPLYLGDEGRLVATPTQAPGRFIQQVGVALSATRVFLFLGVPVRCA